MKDITEIIQSPILSEKSNMLTTQGKYVFRVNVNSNKLQIKQAIEDRFTVKVKKVSTMNFKGKTKNLTIKSDGHVLRTSGKRSGWKKAIITLSKGTIDILHGDFQN